VCATATGSVITSTTIRETSSSFVTVQTNATAQQVTLGVMDFAIWTVTVLEMIGVKPMMANMRTACLTAARISTPLSHTLFARQMIRSAALMETTATGHVMNLRCVLTNTSLL